MRQTRHVADPPYTIKPEVLRRFDQGNTAFSLLAREQCAPPTTMPQSRPAGGDGFHNDFTGPEHSIEDGASDSLARIGRFVHNRFRRLFEDAAPAAPPAGAERPADPAANAKMVKHAARQFGADLAGICEVNPLWVYARDEEGRKVELPASHRWAVVMATAMDADAIRRSAPAANAATHLGYMRMAIHASCLARFIEELGHAAVACRNDTALSIPLAIDAGLGEMGRSGSLITPRFGPCVRLCKVFTDMPLAADSPIEFGVGETCRACRRCAEACPAGAISTAPAPSFETVCPANNPGVLRYPVNAVECLRHWRRTGRSCSACLAACPLTPSGQTDTG